jgi:diguanylate cyclase (GGDEF)-like protein
MVNTPEPPPLVVRLEKLAAANSGRIPALAPLDDFSLYRLVATEMARAALQEGGDGLILITDGQTAHRIDLLDEVRASAQAIYIYGEPPPDWARAGNVIAAQDEHFREQDRICLLFSSQLALAAFGTLNLDRDFGADSFEGFWTTDRETVTAFMGILPGDADVSPRPALATSPGHTGVAMRLAAMQAGLLASRQRDISMDKDDLSSVLEILKAISAKRSAHDILYVFVEKIASVVSADRCSIVRVWGESRTGQVMASHEDATLANHNIELDKYPELIHVQRTAESAVINDVASHPITRSVATQLKAAGVRSLLVIPIVLFDRNVGSLFLRAMRTRGSFTLREISFFEIVAEAASNALERAELFESIQRANERLEVLATTDGLTGLFNHRRFRERLAEEVERALRYDTPLACMIFDVDDFKLVNDKHGHLVGDRVLCEIAERTARTVRRSDIVARYGGEEFVVIMPQTTREGAMAQAERLRVEVANEPFGGTGTHLTVTISVGVSTLDRDTELDSEAIILKADRALYRAKGTGKNRVEFGL